MNATSVKRLDRAFAGKKYQPLPLERILSGGFPDSLLAPTPPQQMLWMDSFRTTYLERDLRRISDIGKRMVKAPKIYWNDVGLAAHLCGITSIEALRGGTMHGRLVETLLMMEIHALLPLAETPAKLFHVRTHDGLEVDGLLETGQRHLPLEIKASRTVTASDAAPIERWIALN